MADFDPSKIYLDGCVPSCKERQLHSRLIDTLKLAQAYFGENFHINSAFRSLTWESSKGRSGKSSHCKGLAVDIATKDHEYRRRLVLALSLAGFKRIGIASTFIHADLDEEKNPSLWLYDKNNLNETF